MSFLDDELEYLNTVIGSTAYIASRKYVGYADPQDIGQQLWEWVTRNKSKLARWKKDNDEADYERLVGSVLRDEATRYGRAAKADILGYRVGDEFYYTKGMLATLLPSVYDREAWVNPPQETTGGRSGNALNEGHGWVATLTDVSRALDRLSHGDQVLLRQAYLEEIPRNEMAFDAKITRRGIDARVESALKRLWNELGGPKWLSRPEDRVNEHKARKVTSNAHARAITEEAWNPA